MKTFLRSAINFEQFAKARKTTRETGLTYGQAQAKCQAFNANRTPKQIVKGTKMEFSDE